MPVKVVEVKARASDKEFAKNEGKFFDVERDFKIFDEDVDVYGLSHEDDVAAGAPKRRLLLKLRKNVFTPKEIQGGWDAFRLLAIPSRNRGAAAGPIDLKSTYWRRRKAVEISGWSARYIQDGKKSAMRVNNSVSSGVIGNYEKTPFMKAPCRLTGYTRRGLKYFQHGIPFIQSIAGQFKHLVPDSYAKQYAVASKMPLYQIPETPFSTVTVNMNFRTALHKDAGDYHDGFGNLTVLEWGRYHGGETLFPRFGVGINLRTGDFVAMDVHEWHCNAALTETPEDAAYNKTLPDIRTREAFTGVEGSQRLYQRISLVCYFREKIQDCIEKDTHDYYERMDFNLKEKVAAANAAPIKSIPIPDRTGTLEEAFAALGGKKSLRNRGTLKARKLGRWTTHKRKA